MKIYKCQKEKVEIDPPIIKSQELNNPGLRCDNEFLQYNTKMSEQELIDYWNKPFSVKPANGFYAWTKPQVVLRISDDTEGGLISDGILTLVPVENSLDSIPSPSPSVKVQIIGGKVFLG